MQKKAQKVKSGDEAALIRQVKRGNREAYQEIVKEYQKKLFSYVYRLTGSREETEDIVQNVFVKAYRGIKSFDNKKRFSPWIYRIAHNEAVNYLKKRNKKKFVSWEDIVSSKDKLEMQSEERSPLDDWLRKESKRTVEQALEQLPKKYQEVLTMRYFAEKSYEEIGEVIGKSVNTVGTLISRAKKRLLDMVHSLE